MNDPAAIKRSMAIASSLPLAEFDEGKDDGNATSLEDCIWFVPDEPAADRYYFSGCLAGAVLDDVSDYLLDGRATVNEGKPETRALYGGGIFAFTRGIRIHNIDQIEDGITAMIEHHTRSIGGGFLG